MGNKITGGGRNEFAPLPSSKTENTLQLDQSLQENLSRENGISTKMSAGGSGPEAMTFTSMLGGIQSSALQCYRQFASVRVERGEGWGGVQDF